MQTKKTTRKVLLSLQALALACTVSLAPRTAQAEDAPAGGSKAPAAANPAADATGATATANPAADATGATPAAAATPPASPTAATTTTPATTTTTPAAQNTPDSSGTSKLTADQERRAKRKAQEEAEKEAIRKKKEQEKGSYYGTFGSTDQQKRVGVDSGTDTYYNSIKSAPKIAPPPPSAPIPLAPVIIDGAHQKVAPSANPIGAAGKGWKDDTSISGSITLTRHVNTAKEMLEKGQWTLAKKHYGAAMGMEPANMEYMIGYYKACLLGQDWPSVINTLEKIFRQDPTKEKLYYADYGKALYFNNQVPQATAALKRAVTLGCNPEGVHETMLGMYQYQRDYPNVILEYKALIKCNPARTDRIKALAELLWQTSSQTEAASYYKQYAKARPSDAEAQQQLGYILCAIKDYAGSIAAYKKALTISPADQRAKQGLDYAIAQQKAAAPREDD